MMKNWTRQAISSIKESDSLIRPSHYQIDKSLFPENLSELITPLSLDKETKEFISSHPPTGITYGSKIN